MSLLLPWITTNYHTPSVCVYCKRLGMKTVSGNEIRIRFYCNMCDVPLCKNCNHLYHNLNL